MTTFQVREVFRLPRRRTLVIAGTVLSAMMTILPTCDAAASLPQRFDCRQYDPVARVYRVRSVLVDLENRRVDGHYASVRDSLIVWRETDKGTIVKMRLDLKSGDFTALTFDKDSRGTAPASAADGSCRKAAARSPNGDDAATDWLARALTIFFGR